MHPKQFTELAGTEQVLSKRDDEDDHDFKSRRRSTAAPKQSPSRKETTGSWSAEHCALGATR